MTVVPRFLRRARAFLWHLRPIRRVSMYDRVPRWLGKCWFDSYRAQSVAALVPFNVPLRGLYALWSWVVCARMFPATFWLERVMDKMAKRARIEAINRVDREGGYFAVRGHDGIIWLEAPHGGWRLECVDLRNAIYVAHELNVDRVRLKAGPAPEAIAEGLSTPEEMLGAFESCTGNTDLMRGADAPPKGGET